MADKQVVVLGSGAAGAAAALAAAASGAEVTLLERSLWLGGTTATSGGGIWVPDNPWAAAAGADDSAEQALTYLAGLRIGDVDDELVATYVHESVAALRSIEERSGLRWQPLFGMLDYHCELAGASRFGRSLEIAPIAVDGGILDRLRPDPYGQPPWTIMEEAAAEPPEPAELDRRTRLGVVTRGRGLVAALCAAAERLGAEIRTDVAGAELLLLDGGAVVGVDVGGEILTGSVVLATGGFERDRQLVDTFLRTPVLAPAGPPSNDGGGLRMAMRAGAALGNMSEAWWCAAVQIPGETLDGAPFARMLFLDLAKPGGLVVDGSGHRFADEATNYNDYGRMLGDLDGADFAHRRIPSWWIFDDLRYRTGAVAFMRQPAPDGDWLVQASTLAELAVAIGVDGDTLTATVERFNQGVAGGVDEFGRGRYVWDGYASGGEPMRAIGAGPFFAVRVLPGCLGTKGGMRIDGHGRVRSAAGGVIGGLYAAGNAAASPFGCAYPGPGATIGPALVFGTRAGEHAASAT